MHGGIHIRTNLRLLLSPQVVTQAGLVAVKKILVWQKRKIDTGKLTLESKNCVDENLCNC